MNYALRSAAVHDTTGSQAAELNHLHQLMREAFNLEELRELCLDLAIDYEDLGEGLGKSDRILALIYTVVDQGRQQDLLQALVQRRSHVKWPSPLTLRHPLPNVAGAVVAGRTGFAVNVNYGTIVYQEATPRVNLRDVMPRPPRAPRGFIGRARELSQLDQLIAANEPVMVWGPDGIGKSTLIRQAAHSQAALALPNGVLFLEGVDENGLALGPGDVIQRLFDALFESEPPLKVNVASARTYLSNTRPLVLLDRLSLAGAALSALPDLFPQSPLLLAAAQRPAGDVAELIRLGPLPPADAVQLLVTKAGLTAGDSDRPELEAIGDLLAGVPLAIVTAANAIRENHLAPGQALARLVAYSPTSSDPVEAAVERAYALVYAGLSPTEQGMLSTVAALPGTSIDKAWLESVAGGQMAGERLQALELLQANSPRLRLSPGLRPVALRSVDQAAAREQLLAFIRQALAAGTFDLAFCEDELGNMVGLIEWAAGQQRWTDVIELGRAIDPCLTLRGLWDAWRNVLDHVLAAGRAAGDRAAEAWALHQLGTREIGLGQSGPAVGYLRQALSLRRELGDTTGAIYTQHNLDFLLPPPPPSSPETQSPPGGRIPLPRALPLAMTALAALAFIAIAVLGRRPAVVDIPPASPSMPAVAEFSTSTPAATPTLAPTLESPTPAATATVVPTLVSPTPSPAATATTVATPTSVPGWRIAFFSDRDSRSGNIYLLNVDESQQTRGNANVQPLTNSGEFIYNPVSSPAGRQVAFISGFRGEREIHVVNSDNPELITLVTGPVEDIFSLAWSPDGERLAFTVSGENGSDIYVASADGTELMNLTDNVANLNSTPAWSPDGDRLAFTVFEENAADIYLVNSDGSGLTNLTSRLEESVSEPAWSPDGTQIAFTSFGNGNTEIYVMNLDGSGLVNLTNNRANDYLPRWSPDGRRLAFLSDRSRETSDNSFEVDLFVMNSDGSVPIRLVDFRSPRGSCDFIFGTFIWSPDGRRLAFDYALNDSEIYLVNADGSGLINLTNNPANDLFIAPGGC